MGSTMEETVADEQAEYERQQEAGADPLEAAGEPGDEPTQPDPDGKALFDAEKFETEELAMRPVDGHSITKIEATFGGSLFLDRSTPADVALVRDLPMGSRHTLLVDVLVGAPIPGYSTSKGGDLDVVKMTRRFTVQGVGLAASDLSPDARLRESVRRVLDSGVPYDELKEIVAEAAQTGRKHAD